MAQRRRGAGGRRPGGGAIAGRLIAAFLAGIVVMGGGLYLLNHTWGAADRGRRGAGTAPTPGPASRLAGKPTGGVDDAAGTTGTGGLSPSAARAVPQPPFGESEEVFETGARVYVAHCAACHGRPGADHGKAAQIWGGAGGKVASEPAGVLFLQIADGVPPGMKGYRDDLRETEIWDLALLLRNAGQELPDPVRQTLKKGREGRR